MRRRRMRRRLRALRPSPSMAQSGPTRLANGVADHPQVVDLPKVTPIERVKLANNMAVDASRDSQMREVATIITRGMRNVPQRAPAVIARWIRRNMSYRQESPGIEILQGPYHSLRHKVIDCDDGAILWVTLTRALGLETYFAGAGLNAQPGILYHAIGYDAGTGLHYELSVDHTYLGGARNGLHFTGPTDSFTVIYRPLGDGDGEFWVSPNPGQSYEATTPQALESGAYRRS